MDGAVTLGEFAITRDVSVSQCCLLHIHLPLRREEPRSQPCTAMISACSSENSLCALLQKAGRNCCPAKVYARAEVYDRAPERADAEGLCRPDVLLGHSSKAAKGGWMARTNQKLKDAIAFFLALITDSNELVPGS